MRRLPIGAGVAPLARAVTGLASVLARPVLADRRCWLVRHGSGSGTSFPLELNASIAALPSPRSGATASGMTLYCIGSGVPLDLAAAGVPGSSWREAAGPVGCGGRASPRYWCCWPGVAKPNETRRSSSRPCCFWRSALSGWVGGILSSRRDRLCIQPGATAACGSGASEARALAGSSPVWVEVSHWIPGVFCGQPHSLQSGS